MRRFTATFVAQCVLVAGVLLGVPLRASHGQSTALADRGPRFLWTPSGGAELVVVDASRSALLRRVVSLKLEQPTVGKLLAEIEAQTGLKFVYSRSVVPVDRRIGLRAESITIAAALTEILLDANVDVVLSSDGQLTFVRRTRRVGPQPAGVLAGRVTDVKTGDGLAGADVSLEGTRWRTTTGERGFYRLVDVEAGTYTLLVRRVGYAKHRVSVRVVASEEVVTDVAIAPMATQLNEIVTTVTGDQRRLELGHVVGVINADSIVKEAPVSNLGELLTGRVPGVQVFTASGQVGGQVRLQIRSPNSINLSTNPIVIVDGIRYNSDIANGTLYSSEPTSRLNDINPNDIETIEIVKGPSAATLYGTDAANGVIVIRTKRGAAGAARWNSYGRLTKNAVPKIELPDIWWGWRTIGGVPSMNNNCFLRRTVTGSCVQDSVSILPNPINQPQNTIFASKPRWEYGANVSGGRDELRYYISSDFERAIGPLKMPDAAVERLKLARGVPTLPGEQLEPNAMSRMNLRANTTALIGKTADIRLTTGYIHANTRTMPTLGATSGGVYLQSVSTNPEQAYGETGNTPDEMFSQMSTERTDRFVGTGSGQWQPIAGFTGRATIGVDLANNHQTGLTRPGEGYNQEGGAGDVRTQQLRVTGDVGLSGMLRRGRMTFRTAVGAQYVRSLTDQLSGFGSGLSAGGESINQSVSRYAYQQYNESVTLGSYLEETVGLNDRLFVAGALRVDGGSAFGQDYNAVVYPKASVSWLVSDEPFMPRLAGLDELRLRYAFGASGQQAYSYMALPDFGTGTVVVDGNAVSRVYLYSIGNPNLKPERVREHEIGFDATGFSGRVQLGLTWFTRRTVDPIVSRSLPPGFGSIYTNFGLVTGRGFEATLTATVVQSRAFSWDLALQHALRRSRLVDLGDAAEMQNFTGSYVEGYPLGARFSQTLQSFNDANGNGIVEFNEIRLNPSSYQGESSPPSTQTLTATFGLFDRRVRVSGLFQRGAGFSQIDALGFAQCNANRCRGAIDPESSLEEQAIAALPQLAYIPQIESGNYTRFRELSVAADVPESVVRALRVRSATIAFSVRNLALWSSFSGPDPESMSSYNFYGGQADGIPQARTWALRVDLGL